MKSDDLVLIERDLLSAACYAIRHRRESPNTLMRLSDIVRSPAAAPQLETKPAAFEVLDHVNGAYVTTNEQAALATEFPYNGLYRRVGALKP